MQQVQNGGRPPLQAFRIGPWLVEPELARISRDGGEVRLRPRAMDVLVHLAMAAGALATKQQLIDAVWRTEFVSDHALTQVIAELRTAFGDDARNPSYIENIPRRGYRLVAEVSPLTAASPARAATLPFKLQASDGEYPLAQGLNVIGRTADAHICIDRDEVSRHHAKILVEGTRATIEDLDSKNGTFLNGTRLDGPARLTNGDEIWIGRSVARLWFLIEGEPTKTETSQ